MLVSTVRSRQWADWIKQAPDPNGLLRHVSRPRVLLVLHQLATYASKDGVCCPTIETVATDTGMSRRAVQAATRFLVFLGLIERVRRRVTFQGVWRSAITVIRSKPRAWLLEAFPRAGERPHTQERRAGKLERIRKMAALSSLAQAHTGAHRTHHPRISIPDRPETKGSQPGGGGEPRGAPDDRTLLFVARVEAIRKSHRESTRMIRQGTGGRKRP